MLTNARVATNLPLLGYTFLKYPYLGLNCKKEELATEGRPRTSEAFATELHGKDTEGSRSRDTEGRKSRSICHGLTRNYTEKTEAKTRKEAEAAEALATD